MSAKSVARAHLLRELGTPDATALTDQLLIKSGIQKLINEKAVDRSDLTPDEAMEEVLSEIRLIRSEANQVQWLGTA